MTKLSTQPIIRTVLLALFLGSLAFQDAVSPRNAQAQEFKPSLGEFIKIEDIFSDCSGECGFMINAGGFVKTPLFHMLGLDGFVPPWEYQFRKSGIVSISHSRPWIKFGHYAQVEPEIGIAQRFGNANSQEIWAALVFRWLAFPWDDFLDTSITVTTGLNYAFDVDSYDAQQDPLKPGRRLLHYFSPEISFALPERKHVEFVIRHHHRSGGRGLFVGPAFGNVRGGAQYLTAGFRIRY